MKKYRVWLIIAGGLVLFVVAVSIWAQVALAPVAKKMIEEKGSEALGAPVTVGSLRVGLFPPLTVTAHDVKFSLPAMKLETDLPTLDIHASVGLNIFHPVESLRSLSIELDDPVWTLTAHHLPSSSANAHQKLVEKKSAAGTSSATSLPDLPVELKIKRGLVKAFGFEIAVNLDSDLQIGGHKAAVTKATGDVAGISFDAKGEQDLQAQTGDWQLTADAKDFKANYKKDDLDIKGPLSAHAAVHVLLSADGFKIQDLDAHADLEKTKLSDGSSFTKPEGTRFGFDIKAQGDADKLTISGASFQLASMTLLVKGYVSQKSASDLQLSLERTPLADLEKLLPAFSGSPVGGFVQMQGQIKGDAANPNALQVHISPLKFEAIKAQVNHISADKKSKAEGSIAGDISLAIGGTYDQAKGFEKSPLSLSGSVQLSSSHLSYRSESVKTPASNETVSVQTSTSEKESVKKQASEKPEPVLPSWLLAQTAQVETSLTLTDLQYNDLKIKGLKWKGKLDRGILHGSASIAKVFDGSVTVNDVSTDLRQAQPDTHVNLKTDQIDINQALTWSSPSWKDLVTGRLAATASVVAAHPSRTDFIARTQAKGTMHLSSAVISTLQLDQLVNQALAKIPGLGKNGFKTNPVAADVKTNYDFNNSVLHLSDFVFMTPDKNELRAQGSVDVNKVADLSGTAYLATAPVGGDIRAANSDAQGRFVIPFQIKGTLTNPQVAFASNTVEQMLKKTAQKALQNFGKKNLGDQLETLKKKGLQGLFGK